jgi:hypothetical protein
MSSSSVELPMRLANWVKKDKILNYNLSNNPSNGAMQLLEKIKIK